MLRGNSNGKLIEHIPCTSCPSSDAMAVYEHEDAKGNKWYNATCFSCRHFEPNPPGYNGADAKPRGTSKSSYPTAKYSGGFMSSMSATPLPTNKTSLEDVLSEFKTYPVRAITDRALTKETCEKYGVRVSLSPHDGETILTHMYPYYKNNKLTGYKERIVDGKIIFSKGDCQKAQLFGSTSFPAGGKTLYITEGELDAMSLYQTLRSLSTLEDYHPAVVSLSHGSASAVKDISQDLDYVNSFQKIVLVFDQDDAGQAAVDEACKLLAGKVYIAKLSEKDPNDMLLKGKGEEMKWEVLKHAKLYMPDNIVSYADCWDRYKNSRNQQCFPFPESWKEVNSKTYGIRMGELVMVTSGSGMGKTQFLRELKYHYFNTTDFKFADIALEEDVGDSIAGLMSVHMNKRITLPDVQVEPEEEKEAFNYLFNNDRWAGYDFFGGMDDSTLFGKIRFMAARGANIIYLDHLSIIVSEFAADGGERERIDTIMTKLAKMVKELNITIFLVVHLKKTSSSTSFEEGATPSLDDLRGSGSLKQLSMTVLAISRNQQHEDPFCANTSKLTVLKCRFTGRTGTADYLNFNDRTGRMVPVPVPDNYEKVRQYKPKFQEGSPY